VTDWILNRWTRYGHDHLYAETPGGTPLGYLDMNTNELHPIEPDDLPLLAAAVFAHLEKAKPDAGPRTSAPRAEITEEAPLIDLDPPRDEVTG
jgi:hypothetical protein